MGMQEQSQTGKAWDLLQASEIIASYRLHEHSTELWVQTGEYSSQSKPDYKLTHFLGQNSMKQ
jgi:hypothetical protein